MAMPWSSQPVVIPTAHSAIWAAQLWPPQKLCASSGQRTTWTTWRSTRGKVALKAQNLRRGFKVNKEYKGSHSYGTISQEEMEEAARIRSRYDEDFASVKKAEAKKSKARKRLLLKRLRPSFQEYQEDEIEERGEESAEAASEDAEDDPGRSTPSTPVSRSREAGGGALRSKPVASWKTSWEGWPAPMDLSSARKLASSLGATSSARRASGRVLQAAARALVEAQEHLGAAQLLLELRDFGVEREVLDRRLTPSEAEQLFDEAAVRLGHAYLNANLWGNAWEALIAACAQPRLSQPLASWALSGLASAAERGCKAATEPLRQVELLQGALDAEAVWGALPRERREGLEIYMALSLEKIGRVKESKALLTRIAQQGSAERRQQAEWALLVQDAESPTATAEGREMRQIWDQVAPTTSTSLRSGRTGAAMGGQGRRKADGLDGAWPVLAMLLLALPLAVPLLLIGR
ncbi:unnamed protein product [Durusdinium trenchii]|uniref:Uncharacterized protein n=2 Tax=Durusdinium trenchii TaxID=1381693 RepID=A0ABP0QRI9_9DINO